MLFRSMNSETELNAAGYSAPICTSSYTTSSPAGPLTISCSGGSATNYNFDTSATATLTISNKTAQTITFNSPGTQTYKTNFSVSATTTASGLSVTITTSGDCTGSGTGTVTITPTLAGSSNCTLTASQAGDATYAPANDVSAVISISKVSLTVTPSALTLNYGDAVPTYSKSVTGFVSTDTADNASGYVAPQCTSSYSNSSSVTTSPLTISCTTGSADNYSFNTSATANLTINKASQNISFTSPGTKTFGSTFTTTAT